MIKWGVYLALVIACGGCMRIFQHESLSAGERLYRAKCRSCHSLVSPQRYSDKEWQYYVEKYAEKSNLTEREKQQILRYLIKNNE